MPGDPYPIISVKPEWVLEPEAMGSKTKFWYRAENGSDWLFKYPQAGTGQHWAEKIAAEAAACLGVMHAPVELAVFQAERGSATESFARDGRNLFHGNQVLGGKVLGYDKAAKFHHSSHTLANIWLALERSFTTPESVKLAKRTMGEYLVIDALIGNTDRHHENWGLLCRRTDSGWKGFVAPSFDHASSLGRELRDEKRERLIAENRVGSYAERGHGGIFWAEEEQRGPSPLELVRRAAAQHPEILRPALEKAARLDQAMLKGIIDRVPEGWMTSAARKFAFVLLCYNLEQLRSLLR
jgi:HipA-like C-terminal domain